MKSFYATTSFAVIGGRRALPGIENWSGSSEQRGVAIGHPIWLQNSRPPSKQPTQGHRGPWRGAGIACRILRMPVTAG